MVRDYIERGETAEEAWTKAAEAIMQQAEDAKREGHPFDPKDLEISDQTMKAEWTNWRKKNPWYKTPKERQHEARIFARAFRANDPATRLTDLASAAAEFANDEDALDRLSEVAITTHGLDPNAVEEAIDYGMKKARDKHIDDIASEAAKSKASKVADF
jgi:hypothetical protein